MTSHKLFSNQVIVVGNFENFFISPGFVPWIRGPGETKERKVGEEDGPLAERDKPL